MGSSIYNDLLSHMGEVTPNALDYLNKIGIILRRNEVDSYTRLGDCLVASGSAFGLAHSSQRAAVRSTPLNRIHDLMVVSGIRRASKLGASHLYPVMVSALSVTKSSYSQER